MLGRTLCRPAVHCGRRCCNSAGTSGGIWKHLTRQGDFDILQGVWSHDVAYIQRLRQGAEARAFSRLAWRLRLCGTPHASRASCTVDSCDVREGIWCRLELESGWLGFRACMDVNMTRQSSFLQAERNWLKSFSACCLSCRKVTPDSGTE